MSSLGYEAWGTILWFGISGTIGSSSSETRRSCQLCPWTTFTPHLRSPSICTFRIIYLLYFFYLINFLSFYTPDFFLFTIAAVYPCLHWNRDKLIIFVVVDVLQVFLLLSILLLIPRRTFDLWICLSFARVTYLLVHQDPTHDCIEHYRS